MNFLIASQVALWIGLLVLGVVCVALARQIGVLHQRIAPAGALSLRQPLKVDLAIVVTECRRAKRVSAPAAATAATAAAMAVVSEVAVSATTAATVVSEVAVPATAAAAVVSEVAVPAAVGMNCRPVLPATRAVASRPVLQC
jgi:hypothetical protein